MEGIRDAIAMAATVLAALDSPAEPTDELKEAMALRRERVAHGG